METPDDALIAAYRKGDASAFTRLYDRHERRLYAFLCALAGRDAQVDDVFQLTWMKAIARLGQYRGGDRFRAWLFRIGHRCWLDHLRSSPQQRERPLLAPAPASTDGLAQDAGPDALAAGNEMAARIEEAVATLPPPLRETLLLRLEGELTHREIAEAMACPLGTTLWRANEALRRVRQHLEETA